MLRKIRAPVSFFVWLFISLFSLAGAAPAQLPSRQCDSAHIGLERCDFLTADVQPQQSPDTTPANLARSDIRADTAEQSLSVSGVAAGPSAPQDFLSTNSSKKQGFRWGRALLESFMFLSIEQAYVVHDDYRWVTSENGVPLNHYWRDYKQSLHSWVNSGWNDGDPLMYGYLGHPIQGAFTSFIQIQNDPKSWNLEFSNSREYWHSRLKATLFNAVYSTQWNIGPLSEMTVEKYGTKIRQPWNQNGTWPCTSRNCYTGVGQIDLVMTPVGGFAWMLGEDLLDKNVARRVEASTNNRFLIDVTRCAINPIRGGASILHGHRPWYRPRDQIAH
jgi:hypothetical protein